MQQAALTFNFQPARVAVLETSPFAFSVTRAMLSGFGFRQISMYLSASEAGEKLAAAPVDIVLCDPTPAPKKTLAMLAELRSPRYGEVSLAPFILITANASIDVIKAAKDNQVDFVIAKPFSPRVLLERIVWSAKQGHRRDATALPGSMISNNDGGDVELW
jgi:CheY-like chemotaxis protein